ncbi:MAG: peroxiredoxin family protein [Parcubacteria group bacterium]
MKNFTLQNNDNTSFKLYDYQNGRILVLIFFRGAWCNHCKKHLLEIQGKMKKFDKLNVKFIAISSDTKFNSSILKEFLKLSFPVISDADFKMIDYFKLKTKYKNKSVAKPAIFVFSPKHEILYQYVGKKYDDRMVSKEIIKKLIKVNL